MVDFSLLRWSEVLAAIGGLFLLASVFIQKTYEARPETGNARFDNGLTGTVSIWQIHSISRLLLVAAAIAPIILVWIIIRDHELSWPRGEVTAVVGLIAVVLILYLGLIDRPGEPSGEIELDWSWYTAAGGALAIAIGGAVRSTETERKRKPPGVL